MHPPPPPPPLSRAIKFNGGDGCCRLRHYEQCTHCEWTQKMTRKLNIEPTANGGELKHRTHHREELYLKPSTTKLTACSWAGLWIRQSSSAMGWSIHAKQEVNEATDSLEYQVVMGLTNPQKCLIRYWTSHYKIRRSIAYRSFDLGRVFSQSYLVHSTGWTLRVPWAWNCKT